MEAFLSFPTIGRLKLRLNNRNRTNNRTGGYMTERMLNSLTGITNVGDFENRSKLAKQALCWQVLKTAGWRRQNHDFRLYHLISEAQVEIDGVTETVPCQLMVRQIGGRSGFHAFLYVENELVMESSHRTDEIKPNEDRTEEEARRGLQKKAEELFGINLEQLYLDCFPVNIYKKPSRKVFWMSLAGIGIAMIAVALWLLSAADRAVSSIAR